MEECLICECSLLESDVPYLIEKAFHNYKGELPASNTIFEYSMCIFCAMEMRDNLSKDSRESLERYMMEKGNMSTRGKALLEKENPQVSDWWSNCVVTNQAQEHLTEYQICGIFQGSNIICSEMPYLLSGEAMDEMSELLSPETLDEMNRFGDEHFTGPPELKELLQQRPVLLY